MSLGNKNVFKHGRGVKEVFLLPKGTPAYVTQNYPESEVILYSGKGVSYNIVKADINESGQLEIHMKAEGKNNG